MLPRGDRFPYMGKYMARSSTFARNLLAYETKRENFALAPPTGGINSFDAKKKIKNIQTELYFLKKRHYVVTKNVYYLSLLFTFSIFRT